MKIKKIISVLLCMTMLVPAAFAENAEHTASVISSEDFSDGMQGWTSKDKNSFYVLNGELKLNNKGTKSAESTVYSDGMNVDNAELEFDVTIKSGDYFAAYFRYKDENTHYVLRFYPSSDKIVLMKKNRRRIVYRTGKR